MNTIARNGNNLANRIKSEELQTLKILEDTKKLKREELRKVKNARKLEEYKFDKFKEIIKNEQYFRISHIDALNLNYDICIHLSAKGAGKTTEIYRMITKVLEKGEKFMYGRVQKNELDREAEEFNIREESPVYAIKHNQNWFFFDKSEVINYLKNNIEDLGNGEYSSTIPTFKKLRDAGLQFVGKGYSFVASNCLSGGKYEGYNTIFFDEILSYSPINRINKKVLDAWDASLHTIQRNKKSLKVYLFGNLQDTPSHPILDHYGIDVSDEFRYITRGDDEKGCKILFVNSGGLYGNTIGHKGGAAHHASAERQAFLKHNRVIKPTGAILTPSIFENMEHNTSFAVDLGPLNGVVFVELKQLEDGDDSYNCICCRPLTISTQIKGEIYTDNPNIYNKFLNTTQRHTIESVFNMVYRLYKYKQLYFDCFESMELYGMVLNQNQFLLYENQPLNYQLCR